MKVNDYRKSNLFIGANEKFRHGECTLGESIGLPDIGECERGNVGDVLATKLNL